MKMLASEGTVYRAAQGKEGRLLAQ